MNRPISRFFTPRRLCLALTLTGSALALPVLAAQSSAGLTTDRMDQLTRQWLDTERQATHLSSDWQQQKPLLEQRIGLLQAEQQQLQGLLQQNNDSSDDVEQQRNQLLAQQAQLETQQASTSAALTSLQARLDTLYPLLPPPLQEGWQSAQQTNSSETLRLQLARLTRLKEFNERVSLHSMRLTDNSGNEVLVQQLYLGLAQAWFSSANGEYRGYGRVENGQWHWHFSNDIDATAVLDAIAIVEKQKPAANISLPLQPLSAAAEVQP